MNTRNSLCLLICSLAGLLIVCSLLLMPADTIRAQVGSSPRIVASYQHENIGFEGFEPNTNLDLEIFSSPGGDLMHAASLTTDSAGNSSWSAWNTFDIKVGQYIVAGDGVTTKDLLVANVRYDALDVVADQARGIAPAGAQVEVYVHGLSSYNELSTVTDSTGAWIVDFGAAGQDIQTYYSTKAYIFDDDGDANVAWEPSLQVENLWNSYVSGQSFTPGGALTVEIYETMGGTLLYSASDIIAGSDHGDFGIPIWQHGQNLQPGTHFVVTDQTSDAARELTLQPLTMDYFDYDQELIAGTAPAGSPVRVAAHTGDGYYEILTEADSNDTWSVDFTTQGVDLNPSDNVYAMLHDLDSDSTRTNLLGFMASITEDIVHWSWHSEPLTATIYDPGGNTVFGPEVFSEQDSMGIDTQDYGINLEPGYQVNIDYGGGRVISLTLADLSVDNLDRDADWVEGTAPPNSTVSVMVWDMCWPYFAGTSERSRMDILVDNTGHWQADFGAQGFDITQQLSAVVFLQEFDGGVSAAAELRNPFNIIARSDDQNISLWGDLTPGSTVALAVYESEGGPLIFEDILTVSPFGGAWWDGRDSETYLPAGTYIEATDDSTGWVEMLTIADVAYEAVDVENDIAQGHAPPGAEVEVVFRLPWTTTTPEVEEQLHITAGEDGRWLADFGDAGIDIPPYANHSVNLRECDGDQTTDRVPYIFDSEDNWIWINSFTPDSPITVEIYDGPGGSLLYGPYELQTNLAGRAFFSAYAYGANLQPGTYSVVTDKTTDFSKAHLLEFVNLEVDVDNDVASGLANASARVFVRFQQASAIDTYADASGYWEADFGAVGVDLTDEIINEFWNTEARVYDADGDRTWDRWPSLNQPPNISAIHGPAEPVAVNTEIQFTAVFTDPDPLDTHTAVWDWGDGTSSDGAVDEGNGTVTGSHTYAEPGVYTVKVTVTDDDGSSDTESYEFIVIYDTDGGFVTGGGWIWSPAGAYYPAPALEGQANFGFVSKYKKGASEPTGNTEFQVKAGDLNFHSDSYDWLVVTHHKAMFKGVGTINDAGNYGFLLSAIDENLTPSTDVDLFRIKIWDKDNNDAIVYDNLLGAEDDADPTTEIGGGNIVVHTSKK